LESFESKGAGTVDNNILSVLLAVASIVVGGAITLGAVYTVEKYRRPDLRFRIPEPISDKSGWRFAVINLVNLPLPWRLGWASRDGAMQCHGNITFLSMDGEELFKQAMPFRWSRADQPTAIRHFIDKAKKRPPVFRNSKANRKFRLLSELLHGAIENVISDTLTIDQNWFSVSPTVDIYPGDPEDRAQFAVVVRLNDEEEYCYGWSNHNYRYGGRSPWALKKGQYLVDVYVHTSAGTVTERFKLTDEGSREGLRLEPYAEQAS